MLVCEDHSYLSPPGSNGVQDSVHPVLPRRPAQDQGQEDMRGVRLAPSGTQWFSLVPHPLRFHATLYQCPETANERTEMSVAVSNRINDLLTVLRTTEEHSVIQLQEIALELDTWKTKVWRRGG